jgi:hypothetical protein
MHYWYSMDTRDGIWHIHLDGSPFVPVCGRKYPRIPDRGHGNAYGVRRDPEGTCEKCRAALDAPQMALPLDAT